MVSCTCFKIYYWPGLLLGLYLFTVITTYLIAVLNGHVYSLFPYISDTGAIPPESCIFSQLLNMVAIVLGITLYIRYRQVDFEINCGNIHLSKKWNTMCFWMMVPMCLGITVTANFQETAILTVHMLGATLVFGVSVFYFFIQTRISFASRDEANSLNPNYKISNNLLYFRIFLSISFFPLCITVGICSMLALSQFKGKTMIWWTEEDGAFQLRLVSTFTEWIYVTLIFIYISTFTYEFKSIKFEEIRFTSKSCNLKNINQEMA